MLKTFLLRVVVLATLLCVSLSEYSFAITEQYFKGDLNRDDRVDIFDLLEMLRLISGRIVFEDKYLLLADIQPSTGNRIDIFDLLGLLRLLAGTEEPERVFTGPAIIGSNRWNAAVGDSLSLYLINMDSSLNNSGVSAIIGEEKIELVQFNPDTASLIVPDGFAGGEVFLLAGSDTTNSLVLDLTLRQLIQSETGGSIIHPSGAKLTVGLEALAKDQVLWIIAVSPENAQKAGIKKTLAETAFQFGPTETKFLKPVEMGLRQPSGTYNKFRLEFSYYYHPDSLWFYYPAFPGKEGEEDFLFTERDSLGLAQVRLNEAEQHPPVELVAGISMVLIPGGSFQMGSDDVEGKYTWYHEQPVHQVTVDSFWIGKTEITRQQYMSLIPMGQIYQWETQDDKFANNPQGLLSWYDAVRFCNLLSVKVGIEMCYDTTSWTCDFTRNGFRLPTEAEWEYACRAGTDTRYNTGNSENDLAKAAWYSSNSKLRRHPVGGKLTNHFGLYDMHGNAFEWCYDWFDYYSASFAVNPTGPLSGNLKILRGGDYASFPHNQHSTFRNMGLPQEKRYSYGVRLARSLSLISVK